MNRAVRFIGWLWLPMPWIWRGCFEWSVAKEAWKQGWKELMGRRHLVNDSK